MKKRSWMKMVHVTVAALTAVLSSAPAQADDTVLLWLVDDPEIALPNGERQTIDTYRTPDGRQIEGARVRVSGADDDIGWIYLNLNTKDMMPVPLSMAKIDNDGEFGCTAGPIWASVGNYASPEYVFAIELGMFEGETWKALAFSGSETWERIRAFTSASPTDVQGMTPWSPSLYAVPEPSGALLVAIGAACIALRRGKTNV